LSAKGNLILQKREGGFSVTQEKALAKEVDVSPIKQGGRKKKKNKTGD